jgi:EAL domain-containing protein (putative c-di-GMP-specific phosphodiesterase class I)/GGDEF domain-containing protein
MVRTDVIWAKLTGDGFKSLRARLTVLYAALFGAAMILVSLAVYGAISANAEHAVRDELTATGAVFDQVWALRSGRLQDGAGLLARDFGFRSAVASRDQQTIVSALDNLKARLNVDIAFMVDTDGVPTGGDAALLTPAAIRIAGSLDDSIASGVLTLGETSYQAIAAPILSPTLTGWVVFARRLDQREMTALEQLSAIPIQATVLHKTTGGLWISGADTRALINPTALGKVIDQALSAKATGRPSQLHLDERDGPSIAVVKRLPALDGGAPAVLLLRYPLSLAMAAYRPVLALILIAGLVGIALVVTGSWFLARSVTAPIQSLTDAVRRLQAGERSQAVVQTQDEIGVLAEGFNEMAAEIADREARILHQARHDSETGLPNRHAYEQAVEAMIARHEAGQVVVAVSVGIDRFEHVRGAIGYAPATALVAEVGRRAADLAPDGAMARLATSMLGLVFFARDEAAAHARLAEMAGPLQAPFQVEGSALVDVHASIGLAVLGVHADDAATLIERAGIAMGQARAARQKIFAFDAASYGDPAANLSLMSEMLGALASGAMDLFYQPKFDLRTRRVEAVEALVRWRHPVRGMLPPDLFIPMAEETGHIRALTDWVLARAIADQDLMLKAGHAMAVSINISGRLLSDMEFADRALEAAALAKGPLCFEITETAVIDNPRAALEVIERFAEAGIAVSIDDYGSGLSSLAYLKQIRADELKIDKAFVLNIDGNAKDALLVRSTIDLAHSLGMKVTAEGVETAEAMQMLAVMGCDVAQGYLIARPTALNELLTFLVQDQGNDRRYG